VETASQSVSRRQNTFQFVDDKLLLYTRRLAAVSDLSVTGITCHVGHLASERPTTSDNDTEIDCDTRPHCDNRRDKVDFN